MQRSFMPILMGLTLSFLVLGCVTYPENPLEVAQKYRDAAVEGKAQPIYEYSDQQTKAVITEQGLQRWLKKNPRLPYEKALEIGLLETWDVWLRRPSGEMIHLVFEDGGWKVAQGGVLLPRFDTPALALKTFFFAATGHIGLLRHSLPNSVQRQFQSDYLMGMKLHEERDRIFKARREIGVISEDRFNTDGERAVLPYGEHKAAVLVLENGRWRVLDLE